MADLERLSPGGQCGGLYRDRNSGVFVQTWLRLQEEGVNKHPIYRYPEMGIRSDVVGYEDVRFTIPARQEFEIHQPLQPGEEPRSGWGVGSHVSDDITRLTGHTIERCAAMATVFEPLIDCNALEKEIQERVDTYLAA